MKEVRGAYMGRDAKGYKYYCVKGGRIIKVWPNSDGCAYDYCSLEEWRAGMRSIIEARSNKIYLFTTG